MKVEIKGKKLVITLDLQDPAVSGSGKTLIVASDRVKTEIRGENTTVAVNAYIPNPDYSK